MKKYNSPDEKGFFNEYGGRFVPPALEKVLAELTEAYQALRSDKTFQADLNHLYREYVDRPSGLYFAQRLTAAAGGAQIYLKREDLNHTGAHKINNTVGQGLVAQKLHKRKLIAETGAGQHGVATATVAAYLGLECEVFMGARDIDNQKMNVQRMKLLGARVIPVTQGQGTLKDAVDVALTAYMQDPKSYYMLGSAVGPHPYPMMVRDFQKIIGEEIKTQVGKLTGKLPDVLVACVGGGSNALGCFYDFIDDLSVRLIAVEPAGEGAETTRHGLALGQGKTGVIHGFNCKVLQDAQGNISESYSAASGLDYPGVGPELCALLDEGRLETVGITDEEAVEAFLTLSRQEGIIPALESAHAVAHGLKLAATLPKEHIMVINLSGRGDKDVENVLEHLVPKHLLSGTIAV